VSLSPSTTRPFDAPEFQSSFLAHFGDSTTPCYRGDTHMIQTLGTLLQRSSLKGIRSSGGYIESSIRLSVTMRMLASASYLDVMLAFLIAESTVYSVMQETTEAICERWALSGIPF
jgi:hypothetical protein